MRRDPDEGAAACREEPLVAIADVDIDAQRFHVESDLAGRVRAVDERRGSRRRAQTAGALRVPRSVRVVAWWRGGVVAWWRWRGLLVSCGRFGHAHSGAWGAWCLGSIKERKREGPSQVQKSWRGP